MSSDAFLASCKPEALGRGGLDANLLNCDPQSSRDVFAHLPAISRQARGLRNDDAVDVNDLKTGIGEHRAKASEQNERIRILEIRIGIWIQGADVLCAFDPCGPEKGIHDRMDQDVSIRMANKPTIIRDINSADDEFAPMLR